MPAVVEDQRKPRGRETETKLTRNYCIKYAIGIDKFLYNSPEAS